MKLMSLLSWKILLTQSLELKQKQTHIDKIANSGGQPTQPVLTAELGTIIDDQLQSRIETAKKQNAIQ